MTDRMSISESEIQMSDKPEFNIPRNQNCEFEVCFTYIIHTCVVYIILCSYLYSIYSHIDNLSLLTGHSVWNSMSLVRNEK